MTEDHFEEDDTRVSTTFNDADATQLNSEEISETRLPTNSHQLGKRKSRDKRSKTGGNAKVSQGRSAYDPGYEGVEELDYKVRSNLPPAKEVSRWPSAPQSYAGPYPFEANPDRSHASIIMFLSILAAVTVISLAVLILLLAGII